MDTLSSSVASLKVPNIHSKPREFYQFKAPNSSSGLPPLPNLSSTKKRNSISNNSSDFTNKNFPVPFASSSHTSSVRVKQPPPPVHRNAASGYAAALLDIARCNNALEAVERDVRRFAKWLRNEQLRTVMADPFMDVKEKGRILKEVAEKGRFNKHLVKLFKLLIQKNRVTIVGEVLLEFERIYDELSGTSVVLVSSERKLEEDELFGIAKRVQKLSGAVKVKVRHSFDGGFLPSYA